MNKLFYPLFSIIVMLLMYLLSSQINYFENSSYNTENNTNSIIESNYIYNNEEREKKDIFMTSYLFESNNIICFYGNPNSKKMGILGRYPKEKIYEMMLEYSNEYDKYNGDKGIILAFYIVYGTCAPKGEISYLSTITVESYINFALSNNILVFLDHQIGKYSVEYAINKLLPFLIYPNVHLALDPEWRTTNPMKEIGSITAEELNKAQEIMQDFILKNNISGKRMLVVHQFHYKMIRYRNIVKNNYDPVILIHTMDGFGPPKLKLDVYKFNSIATNMPYKGFKLFLDPGFKGAGYDNPLLPPEKVLSLNPQPIVIIYQ